MGGFTTGGEPAAGPGRYVLMAHVDDKPGDVTVEDGGVALHGRPAGRAAAPAERPSAIA